jgi:CBS domain-containing protein
MANHVLLASDVMIREIHTIHPSERVALARLRMLRHGVGALPVVDADNVLVGIITLRDIDIAGTEVSNFLVADLMTKTLITGTERTTIGEIVDMMLRTGIQRIPIVDADAKLIGLVTQTTVIKTARRLLP